MEGGVADSLFAIDATKRRRFIATFARNTAVTLASTIVPDFGSEFLRFEGKISEFISEVRSRYRSAKLFAAICNLVMVKIVVLNLYLALLSEAASIFIFC